MKSNIKVFLLLIIAFGFGFNACNKEEDLVTADAKTGGLVIPTASIPYKLGATPKVSISVSIPQGPGITSIEVYNTYTDAAASLVSNQVLMKTVDVASANVSAVSSITISLTYTDLIKDIKVNSVSLPVNEALLAIGNTWNLTYVSVMADGRKVLNNASTTIAVANKYAGFYQSVGVFTHPVNGPRAINEKKFLTPLTAYSCRIPAGDLGSSGYTVVLTVDPATNTVTFSAGVPTDMFASAVRSYFDPASGKFYLHYYYVGSGGNRVMDEVLTPLP